MRLIVVLQVRRRWGTKPRIYKNKFLDGIADLLAIVILACGSAIAFVLFAFSPHSSMAGGRLWGPVKLLKEPMAVLFLALMGVAFGIGLYGQQHYLEHRRRTAVTNVKRYLKEKATMRGALGFAEAET